MKKVLLIGADGMLGGELKERLEKKYEVIGTTLQTLDICDRNAIFAKVEEEKPYFIINCAAYTNVDACEVHEDVALAVNGTAVRKYSRCC
jgi:dTDP-4-dehydrorhamnose reductase